MHGVSKRYPGTLAVDHVDFHAQPGEVHALMGENGAGKSTLMKMLAGSFADYEGDIEIHGKPASLRSPAEAKANGIEMIYQELSLAQPISIAENILAGRLPRKWSMFVDHNALVSQSRHWLERVGLGHIDPMTTVDTLSPHEAQLVEIAKALSNHPTILIMDEPTSSLSRKEVEILFGIIADLKREGLAIIYISHHIPEIFASCDRTTILRDGKMVSTGPIGDYTAATMIEAMVGRSVAELNSTPPHAPPGEELLRVVQLTRYGFFHDNNLHVNQGEILGIGGLAGSGRTELGRSIAGFDPIDEGTVVIGDVDVTQSGVRDRLNQGIAYLTEDRKHLGLAVELSVETNMMTGLNVQQSRRVDDNQAQAVFAAQVEQLQIYPADPQRQVSQLSGGNQQKILLAKWLATKPQLLILDEPTRGVDIGAKGVIHQSIRDLVASGTSVILISSDLPELTHLADRVAVLRRGRIVAELTGDQLNESAILLAANGEEEDA